MKALSLENSRAVATRLMGMALASSARAPLLTPGLIRHIGIAHENATCVFVTGTCPFGQPVEPIGLWRVREGAIGEHTTHQHWGVPAGIQAA